ncbi:hypothetical protein H6F86_20765 [Phormidium sp. FACHB-592]|uniref:Uncharacterized protein n=1 Tax=Stenomitos frigidus AS-A4 TaxID=2933935 RepID=A0ABV0KEJ3_9CYAN|nr:hypothetical protein [Phormidium sp. FACHB-592]MBD2076266.1 hypothetical protein [Phormidium sp. FACHB-592]
MSEQKSSNFSIRTVTTRIYKNGELVGEETKEIPGEARSVVVDTCGADAAVTLSGFKLSADDDCAVRGLNYSVRQIPVDEWRLIDYEEAEKNK